jgi:hypothetical protein
MSRNRGPSELADAEIRAGLCCRSALDTGQRVLESSAHVHADVYLHPVESPITVLSCPPQTYSYLLHAFSRWDYTPASDIGTSSTAMHSFLLRIWTLEHVDACRPLGFIDIFCRA